MAFPSDTRNEETHGVEYKSGRRHAALSMQSKVDLLGLTVTGTTAYSLLAFLDPGIDQPIDGLDYRNNPLQNCSVQKLELAQFNTPITQYQVIIYSHLWSISNQRLLSPVIPRQISSWFSLRHLTHRIP
jgi:hypothetical protein